LIRKTLFPIVKGRSPFAIPKLWQEMNITVRNYGRSGIAACAIAAVDMALWDLRARLEKLPLAKLLGKVRHEIPVYGSGGFTSYTRKQLQAQFARWVAEGISTVKMKIGREPSRDAERVKWARDAIGTKTGLFVDANGAFSPKKAVEMAGQFSNFDVRWYEEPVTSDDLRGLAYVQEHAPATMEIAAGEYNFEIDLARRMLEARSVDVLQADATRCGVTGFLKMADLCTAFKIPLSAHTAPAVHAHLCCAAAPAVHVEYFHDHLRLEQLFFEGATVKHKKGFLIPDSEPGLGLAFKQKAAAPFHVNI
jgi:L-alanine-DL-glutamate epimerase-like enolase superfamily enzyme